MTHLLSKSKYIRALRCGTDEGRGGEGDLAVLLAVVEEDVAGVFF